MMIPETPEDWFDRASKGDGAFAIACALCAVGRAIQRLGTADAATPFGAVEMLSKEVKSIADSIDQGLFAVADAIQKGKIGQ